MENKGKEKKQWFQGLGYLLTLGISAKLLVDTTVQIVNPFLTVIAAGVGIGVVAMGRLVALRNLVGLSAPVLGSLADRIGHRNVIRISLLLTGAGI